MLFFSRCPSCSFVPDGRPRWSLAGTVTVRRLPRPRPSAGTCPAPSCDCGCFLAVRAPVELQRVVAAPLAMRRPRCERQRHPPLSGKPEGNSPALIRTPRQSLLTLSPPAVRTL